MHDAWEAEPLDNDAGMNIVDIDYAPLAEYETLYCGRIEAAGPSSSAQTRVLRLGRCAARLAPPALMGSVPRLGLAVLDYGVGVEGTPVEVSPVRASGAAVNQRVEGSVAGEDEVVSTHSL